MGNLLRHAERELELAGLFDEESDYGGLIGESVMQLINVFETQGHSGHSASMVIQILNKLLAYEPLTPLTYGPDEWFRHEGLGENGTALWQNIRNSSVFSNDGGVTWYAVE